MLYQGSTDHPTAWSSGRNDHSLLCPVIPAFRCISIVFRFRTNLTIPDLHLSAVEWRSVHFLNHLFASFFINVNETNILLNLKIVTQNKKEEQKCYQSEKSNKKRRLKKAEFRETSKLSLLSLNCHFWWKITKNDNKDEFLDFYWFTLNMNFKFCTKTAIFR